MVGRVLRLVWPIKRLPSTANLDYTEKTSHQKGENTHMLLELAIGDAYGAGFEYADTDIINHYNDLSSYRMHPRHHIQPGSYTDDTQMSLAIAEAIVAGEPWTPAMLAHKFVEAFQRDP